VISFKQKKNEHLREGRVFALENCNDFQSKFQSLQMHLKFAKPNKKLIAFTALEFIGLF
jgi:hypothetical protein